MALTQKEQVRLTILKKVCLTVTGKYRKTAKAENLQEMAALIAKRDAPAARQPEPSRPISLAPESDGSHVGLPKELQQFIARGFKHLGRFKQGHLFKDGESVYRVQQKPPVLFRLGALQDFDKEYLANPLER